MVFPMPTRKRNQVLKGKHGGMQLLLTDDVAHLGKQGDLGALDSAGLCLALISVGVEEADRNVSGTNGASAVRA